MCEVMLPDWLSEDLPDKKEEFVVDTLEKAEWAVTKAAESMTKISRADAQRKHYIDLINKRYDEITAPWKTDIEFREEQAGQYLKQQIYAQKKGKSFKLLQGTAKMRDSEVVIVEDEQKVLKYLEEEELTAAFKVEKKVIKKELKKIIESGITIPGCKLQKNSNFTIDLTPIPVLEK